MRVLLMGPPGAGKGTQAAVLAERLGVPHVATGDMFRRERDLGTPLGEKVGEIMARGDLVPDELTNEIVASRLKEPDVAKGFVLDGFPRTVEQADVLDRVLDVAGAKIDIVIKMMITGDEIVARLGGRRVCPTCKTNYNLVNKPPKEDLACDLDGTLLVRRADDDEVAIRRRLEAYGEVTKPLFELYEARGLLKEVDAIGTPHEVFERLLAAVGR